MYNLRYHIASLVAVFLALSVGLLLGTVVVERGVLSAQKTTLVTGLQKDYDTLRAANQKLTAESDTLGGFATESVAVLTRGALTGRTIVLMGDASSGDALKNAVDAVQRAGATPVVMTWAASGFGLGDAAVREAVAAVLGGPAASVDGTRVAATLATEWTSAGAARTLTAALQSSGAVRIEGLQPDDVVVGAVDAVSWNGEPDGDVLRLLGALSGPTRPAVGVETAARPTGLAEAAALAGLSAVDDIDTPLGSVSLVWLLAGRATGSFGSGKGVDGPYPTPLFPTQ